MTTYRLTFDRIGRNHAVPPQDFVAEEGDGQALAHAIYNFAGRFLASREVEIYTDLEGKRGNILVGGFRPAGNFTIEVVT